jgi:hypothetical protein
LSAAEDGRTIVRRFGVTRSTLDRALKTAADAEYDRPIMRGGRDQKSCGSIIAAYQA